MTGFVRKLKALTTAKVIAYLPSKHMELTVNMLFIVIIMMLFYSNLTHISHSMLKCIYIDIYTDTCIQIDYCIGYM